jgi:hypothetical protein
VVETKDRINPLKRNGNFMYQLFNNEVNLRFVSMGKVKLSRYRHAGDKGERSYSSYSFLTSALDEGERSASRPSRALHRGKGHPGTHWVGGWVGLRAGLDTVDRVKILCLCRGSNPGRPVCRQTLY